MAFAILKATGIKERQWYIEWWCS